MMADRFQTLGDSVNRAVRAAVATELKEHLREGDDAGNAVLSTINLARGETLLATVFTAPNLTQSLVFSWTGSKNGAGFDVEVAAAVVPVPAAGFLLLGALGGIAALRRRKTA